MQHTIRYRRPSAPWSLERMTTQTTADAGIQVRRLTALGYTVVEITPPLEKTSDEQAR